MLRPRVAFLGPDEGAVLAPDCSTALPWADASRTATASFCSAARIYLKPVAPDDEPSDVVLSDDDEPVLADFGCGLLETFVVNEGDGFTFVQHRHLRAVGWTPAQLRLDGNFEASLLTLDELWDDALREYAPRGAVAAVPCRDVVAFCDVGSADGIAELYPVIERVGANRYPIASRPLRRLERRWVPFVADP